MIKDLITDSVGVEIVFSQSGGVRTHSLSHSVTAVPFIFTLICSEILTLQAVKKESSYTTLTG